MPKYSYGYRPDLADQRDWLLEDAMQAELLPAAVDLRQYCPPVYDQGQLGSCTANALAGNVEFDEVKQLDASPYVPSRLFLYYNERVLENTVNSDAGASLRDGIKALVKWGDCDEAIWPYNIQNFAITPPANCFSQALNHKITAYLRVNQKLSVLQTCLAAGFPFVAGFTVYESFESQTVTDTGVVPMPKHGEAVLGGHAVLVVGYDTASGRFICRNSWGDQWGDKGYFTIPFTYYTNTRLSSDFWTIRFTEVLPEPAAGPVAAA